MWNCVDASIDSTRLFCTVWQQDISSLPISTALGPFWATAIGTARAFVKQNAPSWFQKASPYLPGISLWYHFQKWRAPREDINLAVIKPCFSFSCDPSTHQAITPGKAPKAHFLWLTGPVDLFFAVKSSHTTFTLKRYKKAMTLLKSLYNITRTTPESSYHYLA